MTHYTLERIQGIRSLKTGDVIRCEEKDELIVELSLPSHQLLNSIVEKLISSGEEAAASLKWCARALEGIEAALEMGSSTNSTSEHCSFRDLDAAIQRREVYGRMLREAARHLCREANDHFAK